MTHYLKLILLRHGESDGNRLRQMEGQTSTGLSCQGQVQARRLSAYLQTQTPPTHLYSSPLRRAMETAQLLPTDRPLHPDPLLQELHPGIFQGLTWQEAQQRYPELCTQLTNRLDYVPIPQAETQVSAHQRALTWHHQMVQRHGPGDVVWLVSHGGFMQHMVRVILGCDRTWQIPMDNTALFEFWCDGSALPTEHKNLSQQDYLAVKENPERWKIVKFNQTSHLH